MRKPATSRLLIFMLLIIQLKAGFGLPDFSMSEDFGIDIIQQDSSVLKTLYDSARFYSRSDPVLSKNLLHKLIAVSKSQDSSNLYDYYALYGNACVLNGEFNEALYYYNKSMLLDRERQDTLEQIRIYNNLNYLYMLSGRLDLSLRFAHEGIRLIEQMKQHGTLPATIGQFGNKPALWVEAYFYSNIGQINMKAGNYSAAVTNYKRALKAIELCGDKVYLANTLNDIAIAYRQLKKYSEALNYCQRAVAINKEIDNEYGIGLNYQTLGDIYAETRNLSDATTLLNEGMEILVKSDDINAQSMTLLSIVGLQIRSRQYDFAQANLNKCFALINASSDLKALRDYHYYQFKLDSVRGRQQNALAHFIKFHAADREINDVKISQQIAEVQTAYETQRKEHENKLLKAENEVQRIRINKARSTIFSICAFFTLIFVITLLIVRHQRLLTRNKIVELKQKNLNQQMNPHFVYNCLTSIQSYIFQHDAEKSLNYLTKFSRLMRKILESSQYQYMSVQDEIEMLNLYLKLESIRFKEKFEYTITVDEKIDPLQFKIPSLLIQPFVENSLWHGIQNKAGKGKIAVSFDLSDQAIFCTIEDNGIGRAKAGELKQRLLPNHISLGSSITQERMKLLRSLYGNKLDIKYIDLKNRFNEPVGTRVEMYLPILN